MLYRTALPFCSHGLVDMMVAVPSSIEEDLPDRALTTLFGGQYYLVDPVAEMLPHLLLLQDYIEVQYVFHYHYCTCNPQHSLSCSFNGIFSVKEGQCDLLPLLGSVKAASWEDESHLAEEVLLANGDQVAFTAADISACDFINDYRTICTVSSRIEGFRMLRVVAEIRTTLLVGGSPTEIEKKAAKSVLYSQLQMAKRRTTSVSSILTKTSPTSPHKERGLSKSKEHGSHHSRKKKMQKSPATTLETEDKKHKNHHGGGRQTDSRIKSIEKNSLRHTHPSSSLSPSEEARTLQRQEMKKLSLASVNAGKACLAFATCVLSCSLSFLS